LRWRACLTPPRPIAPRRASR